MSGSFQPHVWLKSSNEIEVATVVTENGARSQALKRRGQSFLSV